MLPVIGIPISQDEQEDFKMSQNYANRIIENGGLPFFLPVTTKSLMIPQIARKIDGLLLPGGVDIDPNLYGEQPRPRLGRIVPNTDAFEVSIIKEFLGLNKPIFGICRGCQILNVALGGTLYQDLVREYEGVFQHQQSAPRWHSAHTIVIDPESRLYQLADNKPNVRVNTYHHQAVKTLGSGLKATAHALDGVIEAFENPNHRFLLGVQWHPESMVKSRLTHNLFAEFLKMCS